MIVRLIVAANLFATVLATCLAVSFLSGAPANAATPDEKLATCGWSADEASLTGVKRKAFMAKCTADTDSPRGKPVGGAPASKPKPKPQ